MHWSEKYSTPEMTDIIRGLAEAGLSASEIASSFNASEPDLENITRNAVIGRINRSEPRIQLARGGNEVRSKAARAKNGPPRTKSRPIRRERPQRVAAPVRLPTVTARAEASPPRLRFVILDEVGGPIHQDALSSNSAGIKDSRCRYPLWPDAGRPKQGELLYCGKKTLPNSSWCADCHAKVFMAPRTKVTPAAASRTRPGRGASPRDGWHWST